MERKFRTPHGTEITLIGNENEVNYVLKECLRRNKIVMEIIRLEDILNAKKTIGRHELFFANYTLPVQKK